VVPLAAGLVVLVRFPFSDLSQTKLRPAIVLANAGRGDWILCQVTSKPYADSAAVVLEAADFQRGSLRATSVPEQRGCQPRADTIPSHPAPRASPANRFQSSCRISFS